MITYLITDNNQEKAKEILMQMLNKIGNLSIGIMRQENMIKIIEKDDFKDMVSLRDKIIELEEALYNEKKGSIYKAMLAVVEKPLIEFVLERAEGNQLKAARILGINRNTIRSKIKKLGIRCELYKE
jgi:DNA-binding protein Fis